MTMVRMVVALIVDNLAAAGDRGVTVERRITGFRQDEEQHWVAELECGHAQHVRHDPPWQVRPWVLTPSGRAERIGTRLPCRHCAVAAPCSDA
jgi:hypothetical protein